MQSLMQQACSRSDRECRGLSIDSLESSEAYWVMSFNRYSVESMPFPYNQCEKSFSKSDHLKIHLRIHTKEKPFPCNQCDKSFSVSDSLKKHMRIHTGEKPFPCYQCDKSFYVSGSLKKHMRIQTVQKPTNQCDKYFSQSRVIPGCRVSVTNVFIINCNRIR